MNACKEVIAVDVFDRKLTALRRLAAGNYALIDLLNGERALEGAERVPAELGKRP